MTPHLFAYGFLKMKYHGNKQTRTPDFEHRYICEGTITGEIYNVETYPGVIFDQSSKSIVYGEVFELIDPEISFGILDEYEHAKPLIQFDPDYERRLRPVQTDQGIIECWVYEYLKPIDPARIIKSGVF